MKKLALIIVTLAVLCSCKKAEEPAPAPEPKPELVPIQIATTVTRATDYAFETGDNVGLFVVNEPKNLQIRGNHVDNCKFTFDGTKWSAGKEIYWLDATTKADFYCYYPYTSSVPSITAFPFQVSQDQSSESGYKASDLMWGKVDGVSPTPDPVVITVNHSLSCLIVNLKAGTGWKEDDIKDAEITLCGLKTSALVNLADGTVIADGGTAEMKPLPIGAGIFKARCGTCPGQGRHEFIFIEDLHRLEIRQAAHVHGCDQPHWRGDQHRHRPVGDRWHRLRRSG